MKLLHTSDWHLGRALYGRKRTEEFKAFLTWMAQLVDQQQIDILLVAGDIFDTTTPSNRVQNLYYDFLKKIIFSGCQHVIITGGNHDSPTFLEAPAALLKGMHVHVVGAVDEDISKEIIAIPNRNAANPDAPALIVCAVPYLRERDIRPAVAGESLSDKAKLLVKGIQAHYSRIISEAVTHRQQANLDIPIIATGHLFAAGGNVVTGDGVRDLYVGSLAHVPATIFPPEIDYLALGHLHAPQKVGGSETRRYSGSPLPMSFAEAEKTKQVVIVSLESRCTDIQTVAVPVFQKIRSLRGDLPALLDQLAALKKENESIWLELIYNGDQVIGNLSEELKKSADNSPLEILRIVNEKVIANTLQATVDNQPLESLTVEEVFSRCLVQSEIPKKQHKQLFALLNQTINDLAEQDSLGE